MKLFLMSAAVLTLSLGITGTAEAGKGGSRRGSTSYSYYGSRSSRSFYPHYHGSRYSRAYHREYHAPYYQGKYNRFWSSRYWSGRYGSYPYGSPRARFWFYWYQPFGSYYPVGPWPTIRYAY